jgi:hypothetical protein
MQACSCAHISACNRKQYAADEYGLLFLQIVIAEARACNMTLHPAAAAA